MKRNSFLIAVLCIISVIILWSCKIPTIQKEVRFLMDTYCTIQILGSKEVINRAFDKMSEVDKKFNVLNPASPLYSFNENNVTVDDKEIVRVIQTAIQVSKESDGAFDITVYPLKKLWGFAKKSPLLPDREKIIQCLKSVGYKNLIIKNGKLAKLKPSIGVDLGGIAKGYAVGEAVKVLRSAGIKSGLVDAGGNIYALGLRNGRPWRIGIRNPFGEGIRCVVELSDMAIATAGDYERYFEKDGIRYHHIFDPKTGYPARGLASATVICSDPTLADAWSTAIFVLGKEKGMKIVEEKPDLEAVLITSTGEILYSSGLKGKIEIF